MRTRKCCRGKRRQSLVSGTKNSGSLRNTSARKVLVFVVELAHLSVREISHCIKFAIPMMAQLLQWQNLLMQPRGTKGLVERDHVMDGGHNLVICIFFESSFKEIQVSFTHHPVASHRR